jgi:hypothetical protein
MTIKDVQEMHEPKISCTFELLQTCLISWSKVSDWTKTYDYAILPTCLIFFS